MVAGAVSIALMEKRNLGVATTRGSASSASSASPSRVAGLNCAAPFLRIPPFPGATIRQFSSIEPASTDWPAIVQKLRRLRVGGTYWAAQPELPADCLILRSPKALEAAREVADGRPVVFWSTAGTGRLELPDCKEVVGECDPWHMLAAASGVVVEAEDEVRLIASLLGVPAYLIEDGKLRRDDALVGDLMPRHFPATGFKDPFTGQSMSLEETIELCGHWRRLIDSNRGIVGGLGFAFWKHDHVAPLLWSGSDDFPFLKKSTNVKAGEAVAVWRAKAAPEAIAELQRAGTRLVEVEDGFLRSRGLGADCIPPLSITVDALGAYFDPARPSELERLLQDGSFDHKLLKRARELRQVIVEAGIGKYEQGGIDVERPAGDRVHILVPGQVEDDRAVQSGGCGLTSNLELLRRVRAQAPDAYILYKPHPDVVAGHRRGEVDAAAALGYADEIVGEHSINSLIAMVDEVHVNTSLAGFEALLRDKKVTTYGVPFYAGWGLTADLGPVPARRSAQRSLDELVAAALLVYPRYLDPVSGLPCPAEVVVARLAADDYSDPGLLVGVRRLQGKVMRRLRNLVQ